MISFLKRSKILLNSTSKLCVILGNESCDLDSVVSAIALAFFYSKIYPDQSGFIPILNIPRTSFPIKTEVTYFLGKYNITDELLVFKDDTSNEFIKKSSVILVDHHVSPYRDSVIEVFDHRPVDSSAELPIASKKIIEQVGSCATLIADLILRSRGLNDEFKLTLQLLYGAIVMDTVNFSPEACRKTELDSEIAAKIENFVGISDPGHHRENVFAELVKAREDIKSLTPYQLLHKDMKLISNSDGSIRVAIPGYPILVQEFIKKPDAKHAIEMFAKEYNSSSIVLIGMKITNGSDVIRDIGLININNDGLFEEILDKIKIHDKPNLQLQEIENTNFLCGRFFKQENIRATRKQILPIVKKILDEKY
ncbi:exopolyphosphatase PRUNE1 [Episyrphus balteatus]|uniref:exopolyphosphatase PRUNE1 n=1 Tax=Episyrphus balteatus TaxID=286459 RepID=UPI002486B6BC|nr:exopolyphosphatase PRUNE1 [Episyrphus balteatus]